MVIFEEKAEEICKSKMWRKSLNYIFVSLLAGDVVIKT
jgi:hypothetical protein